VLQPYFLRDAEGQKRLAMLRGSRAASHVLIEEQVKKILSDVQTKGDKAVLEYNRRFDAPEFDLSELVVTESEIRAAYQAIDTSFLETLRRAIANIHAFHERQKPSSWMFTKEDGMVLGRLVTAVDAAGIYVPGGSGGETPLVSTVMMCAVPARIAGVSRIVMATPPRKNNSVHPALLVAASESGVTDIVKMGSAWAVAALAYGTETIKPVDVIVGPGNIYVTIAKKMVAGQVGIDMIAGPSEILIIADESADPAFVAADLLGQAEHDVMASSVLLATSHELAEKVAVELALQVERLGRSEIARQSINERGMLLVVESLEQAADISNQLGPEHLELMVSEPWGLLPKIKHAGSIFLGSFTPEAVADYAAGPNHVLPTMGTARFSSSLGVETFMKHSNLLCCSKEALKGLGEDVIQLAETEGLGAHANSMSVRLKRL